MSPASSMFNTATEASVVSGAVQKHHRGNRGHRVDEEVDGDIENDRQTHRHRDPPESDVEGLLEGGGNRFELRIYLFQRRARGDVADGIEVGDGADDEYRHGVIEKCERIVGVVEEEDVCESEHQPRNRHRHHREEMKQRASQCKTAALFHQIRSDEDRDSAEEGGVGRHFDGVEGRRSIHRRP